MAEAGGKVRATSKRIGYIGDIFNSVADMYGNRYWAMVVIRTRDGKRYYGTVKGGESNCRAAVCELAKRAGCGYHCTTEEVTIRGFNAATKGWPHLGCAPEELAGHKFK